MANLFRSALNPTSGITLGTLNMKNDGQIEEYFNRQLGPDRDFVAGTRHIDALSNPKKYLDERNTLLRKFAKSHLDNFKEKVTELVNAGFPEEMAKEHAMANVRKVYGIDMELADTAYPADYFSTVLQSGRLGGKGSGQVGSDKTTAALPVNQQAQAGGIVPNALHPPPLQPPANV